MNYYGLSFGKVAHIYKNNDTLCRLKSTGTLKHPQYIEFDKLGDKRICNLCLKQHNKYK